MSSEYKGMIKVNIGEKKDSLSIHVYEKSFCYVELDHLEKKNITLKLEKDASFEEIQVLKLLLNKWLKRVSQTKLEVNRNYDSGLANNLKPLFLIYDITYSEPTKITKKVINLFKKINSGEIFNKKGAAKLKEAQKLYGLIKKHGATNGIKEFKKTKMKKLRKKMNAQSFILYNPLMQAARAKLNNIGIKNAGLKCDVDKICWRAVEVENNYDIQPHELINIIAEAALKYTINPALIAAVIETESQWTSRAVSEYNANKMMQVTEDAKNDVSETFGHSYNKYDTDTRQNILCGTGYLRVCLDNLGGDEKKAVAGYNAGWVKIQQKNGIPDGKGYKETRDFQKNVLALYEKYRKKTQQIGSF